MKRSPGDDDDNDGDDDEEGEDSFVRCQLGMGGLAWPELSGLREESTKKKKKG